MCSVVSCARAEEKPTSECFEKIPSRAWEPRSNMGEGVSVPTRNVSAVGAFEGVVVGAQVGGAVGAAIGA